VDIEVARHVVRAVFRSSRELQELLELLKGHCSEEEYTEFALAIAASIASAHLEVMNRVLAVHPNLEQEIDAAIKKYHRYL
jgi:hypothetical protein